MLFGLMGKLACICFLGMQIHIFEKNIGSMAFWTNPIYGSISCFLLIMRRKAPICGSFGRGELGILRVAFLFMLISFGTASCGVFQVAAGPGRTARSPVPLERDFTESEYRESLVDFARLYLQTNYVWGGKVPEGGFDCSGFTAFVMGSNGTQLPAGSSEQIKFGREIPVAEVRPGDLIFFGTASKVQHVALVADNKPEGIYCLHATNSGVILENVSLSIYWNSRIFMAREVIQGE